MRHGFDRLAPLVFLAALALPASRAGGQDPGRKPPSGPSPAYKKSPAASSGIVRPQGDPHHVVPARLPDAATGFDRLRTEYTAAYNQHDPAAVAALYATDAVLILRNGTVVQGRDWIQRVLTAEAPGWDHLVIAPLQAPEPADRLGASMAWSIGTTTIRNASGGAGARPGHPDSRSPTPVTSHYVVVIRPEGSTWKIVAQASVDVVEDHSQAPR